MPSMNERIVLAAMTCARLGVDAESIHVRAPGFEPAMTAYVTTDEALRWLGAHAVRDRLAPYESEGSLSDWLTFTFDADGVRIYAMFAAEDWERAFERHRACDYCEPGEPCPAH